MELNEITIIKRNGKQELFDCNKVKSVLKKAFQATHVRYTNDVLEGLFSTIRNQGKKKIKVEDIQDLIETYLMTSGYSAVAKNFILYRKNRESIRAMVDSKRNFIEKYKVSNNTANATVDDNSNVASKNIGVMNNEIHKEENIEVSRAMIVDKLEQLYPEIDGKQYVRDLQNHIIYKHDESSFAGAVAPYCVSVTMYPFLQNGIKGLGGLSARPKNLDSFCGMYINLIFAVSAQFAGAVATSEFLLYFDYFARKEWGDDYWKMFDKNIRGDIYKEPRTIQEQIHQYFQQVIYSINQPAAARGLQSAFVNFSYFDKPFFEGMFGDFYFPDGDRPQWESLNWLQQDFMKWFNEERTKCILTFPVESYALVYQDGKFVDEESAEFVAQEYARGHSFFTYISDTVDSLSSCCRLRNMVEDKEFNFTNGNMGVQTGSKSVITLNLSRIVQDTFADMTREEAITAWKTDDGGYHYMLHEALEKILDRVYRYHTAYNECLWDMFDSNMLPVYKAGFIDLNKQYLTIGLNGLNQAAEFLGMKCNNNPEYKDFCEEIFGSIKQLNKEHGGEAFGHKVTFNTEQVPAESLSIKNYNWDKADGYWVPEDTNLYASYIFEPYDKEISILDKIIMHGDKFASGELDGGMACHINLSEHMDVEQYRKILKFAAEQGCSYFTFNVPNCECKDCGFIAKHPFHKCPKCGSENVVAYDRIIGYLTQISNWSEGRQIEQKTRVYHEIEK